MHWLEKVRARLGGEDGLSLPDPDRIDAGSVPDTALLVSAIAAAMPRTAILQLIGPRNQSLLPFLLTRSIARRLSTGEYFFSVEDDSVTALARAAACFAPDELCSHLLVQDGDDTLLEAFGRDKGEDVVWLSRRLSRSRRQQFLEIVSAAGDVRGARLATERTRSKEEGDTMLRIALSSLVTLALLGCVQPPALVIETSAGDVVALESWTATLSSEATGLRATATLAPGGSYRESLATLTLTGAIPGAVHHWYFQLGECGHELGILAGPQAYTPMTTDARGEGHATAVLPFTVPTEGLYSVSVRQSETANGLVTACGNLTKDRPSGERAIAEARAP